MPPAAQNSPKKGMAGVDATNSGKAKSPAGGSGKKGPPGTIKAPGGEAAKKKQAATDARIAQAAGKRQLDPAQLAAAGKEAKGKGKGKDDKDGGRGGGGAAASGAGGKKKGRGGAKGGGGGGGKGQKKKKKSSKPGKKKGCFTSCLNSLGIGNATIQLSDPKTIEAAQMLDLTQRHLRLLKSSFDVIDLDGSGNIDASEFLEALGEQRSPFTDKLFAVIDVDGSGTIEFDEYVRVLTTYCMFTKDDILRFCFECFDVDGSGTIDEKEFIELCKTVNNANPTFPANFKTALQEFDVNEDGLIDYSEFLEIERRYPLVLFPAFRLQDTMQKLSMGEYVWLELIADYSEQKRIEEYRATHGGRAPPEPLGKRLFKIFCPCFVKKKNFSKMGPG